jgi:hypothetical protein
MFALTETNPPLEIQEIEYQRLLGYPKNRPLEGRARELADGAQRWFSENGRPWICAREISSVELKNGRVRIDGTEFSSARLLEIYGEAQVHSAVLMAVSAGGECEEHARELWNEGKPDEYFFLESLGSAVVEQLIAQASGRICGWADENKMAALPHVSPGYSGWNIEEQIPLWNLFRQNFSGGLPGKLEVLESGMLRPKKSQLGVVGLTRDLEKARRFATLIPCEDCLLPNCRYRRAPYRRPRPQLENFQRRHPP